MLREGTMKHMFGSMGLYFGVHKAQLKVKAICLTQLGSAGVDSAGLFVCTFMTQTSYHICVLSGILLGGQLDNLCSAGVFQLSSSLVFPLS